MVIKRNSNCPFFVFYFLYLFKYQATWMLTSSLLSYILISFKDEDWNFIKFVTLWISDSPVFFFLGLIPIFLGYVYYFECFCMINRIEINEEEKVLQVNYQSFFFLNKTRTFLLDSPEFCCVKEDLKLNILTRIFIPHCNTALELYGDTSTSNILIILRDRCGWEREHIVEIYNILEKYNHLSKDE